MKLGTGRDERSSDLARVIRADRRGPAVIPRSLLDATARAEALLAAARDDAERIRTEARERGREAGRAELASELLRATAAYEQAREHALAALEPQAISIALQAAKQLLAAEVTAHPEQIRAIVAPLLARLRRARSLVLRVHPDDRGALEPWLEAARAKGNLPAQLSVETDAALTRGGCVLRSEIGTLDARVETQLAALARALGVA
jgi:flagellar biosynthesis/type III secretory pathway protein FliH